MPHPAASHLRATCHFPLAGYTSGQPQGLGFKGFVHRDDMVAVATVRVSLLSCTRVYGCTGFGFKGFIHCKYMVAVATVRAGASASAAWGLTLLWVQGARANPHPTRVHPTPSLFHPCLPHRRCLRPTASSPARRLW